MEVVDADFDTRFRAVQAKDGRFDGWFFTAVLTTGIYCRPSCPAVAPKAANVTFHPSAAAAQTAGFRACKRCRPDASPGSPAWDQRADVVARAMRLIADGTVDRDGVPGLAGRLGYSTRQIERHLSAELGPGESQRAQTARLLIETTALPITEVAVAAGFASVRQFNETVRAVFAMTPTELRARAKRRPESDDVGGELSLRLPFRAPLCPDNLFGHLAATAVPGIEEWRDGAYRRTLGLPHGWGVVSLRPGPDHVEARLRLQDLRDLSTAIARCRRLLDLDADPVAVDEALCEDPSLEAVVRKAPGRRVPRTVDADEMAVRAVLGQQVSTAAARTHAGRLVSAHGTPVSDEGGGLTHLWPTPAQLLQTDPAALALPEARKRALLGLVAACAEGRVRLDPGSDWAKARADLLALPGVGPWTVEVIAMRGLGDPDAFLPGDLGVRMAARSLGLPEKPAALEAHSLRWKPWRAYAVQYLWSTGAHAVNFLPTD